MINLEYALNHLTNLDQIRRDLDDGKVQDSEVNIYLDYLTLVISKLRMIPLEHLEKHYLAKVNEDDISNFYQDAITRLAALKRPKSSFAHLPRDPDQDFSLADKLRPAYETNRVVPQVNYLVSKLPSAYMPGRSTNSSSPACLPKPKKEKITIWGWIKSKF